MRTPPVGKNFYECVCNMSGLTLRALAGIFRLAMDRPIFEPVWLGEADNGDAKPAAKTFAGPGESENMPQRIPFGDKSELAIRQVKHRRRPDGQECHREPARGRRW
jgi:hypothetical protein